jgi:hypothetical protein
VVAISGAANAAQHSNAPVTNLLKDLHFILHVEAKLSSASRTDWQIVREFCGRYMQAFRTCFRLPSARRSQQVKDPVPANIGG